MELSILEIKLLEKYLVAPKGMRYVKADTMESHIAKMLEQRGLIECVFSLTCDSNSGLSRYRLTHNIYQP